MSAKRMREVVGSSTVRVWQAVKAKVQSASGEIKSTAVGALAGGAAATTAGAKVGIAAFGTAVSGAALLPVAACIGVGSVVGYAGYKFYQDVKKRRAVDSEAGRNLLMGPRDTKEKPEP
jgi:hypothetical protein